MDTPQQQDASSSPSQQSGRKRHLEEVGEATSLLKEQTAPVIDNLTATIQDTFISKNSMQPQGPLLHRLLLEAVFHPKFENETRNNQDVRMQMKERILAKRGYLEVSLKHSGSLLLWSGGQRFYSKNSTENRFTHVGEIITRQHFYRAWWDGSSTTTHNNSEQQHAVETAFRECSDYVEKHRLTLAFELVTDVLGHHGAIPHADFLILTAVADKREERFYSTSELVSLAQQFRLPHNDSWVFCTPDSTDALFGLYDTTRETGLAHDTLEALSSFADAHVCSMYPHVQFQGNILEGIVIRYVPYRQQDEEQQLVVMKQLADASRDILSKVPPERPLCFELAASRGDNSSMPLVLTTNVRNIFQQCMTKSKTQQEGIDSFAAKIRDILVQSDDNRRTVERWSSPDKKNTQVHLPTMVKPLLEKASTADPETKRIAKMISTLDSLKGRVEYKIMRETMQEGGDRWLCVVHVHFDSTFQKYHKNVYKGDMALFRGCCIELVMEDGISDVEMMDRLSASENENVGENNEDGALMLKMKFLPYMVRTFGCRNGLNALKNGGPEAFINYTMNLMTKWAISRQAIDKWQPFFQAWANYAYPLIEGQANESSETSTLLPLNSTFYLDHLEKFSELYHSGKLKPNTIGETKSAAAFRGLVVVVALEKETATTFASFIAQELGGIRECSNLKNIKDHDLIRSQATQGGGLVCSATIENGVKDVRKHFTDFLDSISVVLVGCDKESIASVQATEQSQNILASKANTWRKNKCAVVEVAGSALPVSDAALVGGHEDIQNMLKKLWETSKAISKPDTRPGLLLFFPGIPGCGKSTLCDAESRKEIEGFVKGLATSASSDGKEREPPRSVIVLEGDKCKKKYWQVVKQQRVIDPSSIYIADKNVPPPTWSTIGNTCSQTQGVAIPVLPDDASLITTSITGARRRDGSYNADMVHYYPFSLHYIAVCMARVVNRPSGSHNGKLDSATENACMIVTMFVGLYRNIAADQFLDVLKRRIDGTGTMPSLPPVRVPFFRETNLPPLPSDLDDALRKALQLQYGGDKATKNAENKKDIVDMEHTLRSLLKKHNAMLQELTVDEKVSRESFLSQTEALIKELQLLGSSSEESICPPCREESSSIKLVSVDVGVETVHSVLRKFAKLSKPVSSFINMASEGATEGVSGNGTLPGENFVKNTHVTMAHFAEMDQNTMHELYGAVEGHSVEIEVNGFLWSDSVAALSVSVASATDDEQKAPVRAPGTHFQHITVWFRQGANAVLSNELPTLLKAGEAQRFDLEAPVKLKGAISFWSNEKSSSS